MKICSKCKESKPDHAFSFDTNHSDGLTSQCRNCSSEQRRNRNNRQPERLIKQVQAHMIARCENPKNKDYQRYGGRGIEVCPEWYDKELFLDFCLNTGWKPGLELDRINNDGNYCPENCRFVTRTENNRNSSCTILTMESVSLIKGMLQYSFKNGKEIGEIFSVAKSTISMIHKGHNWKDIDPCTYEEYREFVEICPV